MNKRREDFYYREAKRRGYRARSAFKLIQIQKRFKIIRRGDSVLDLGASPGGWSQVALELVGSKGKVIGIDVSPIKSMDGAVFIVGDITKDETIDILRDLTGEDKFDVIISDLSPKLSGNRALDQARSFWLCLQALRYVDEFLKTGGNFVCKAFEGSDLPEFLNEVESRFSMVKRFSPKASRKRSKEIYVIGFGKKIS
ncbi:MAG TPA: RlmE family RNA methyltransferase [Thermoplasmatales archaeon]|nr:RlmE family RNA methyltransferase [Thermoplasmatales archaeon]